MRESLRSGRGSAAGSLAWLAVGKELPLDLTCGERLAEEESLHLGTAFGRDPVELFPGFHAFGGRRHAHSVGERRDRPHDIERTRIFRDVLYERSINLDFVERKTLKIGQRGISD